MSRWVWVSVLWLSAATTVLAQRSFNVYRAAERLPVEVRRVALLPLAGEPTARDTLGPVWVAEWQKSARFEVVPVSHSQLREWTGRDAWAATDRLPADLLGRVQEQTGCDAVVLAEVTTFHAYPPLRTGWRARCVTVEGDTLWAVDEVFDMSCSSDAMAARHFGERHFGRRLPAADPSGIGLSPRRFGQFSVATILASLPVR